MEFEALIKLIFTLVGGLGIFLLGMKNMSEGMQAVAGNGLRRIVSAVTNNRFLATGAGVAVTVIVQSSSVTTVMVIGFVNSAVMELSQAIGVIMGANIGTTITGWILVLKIGKYGLPLLGAAAFVYLFSRGDRWRYWAMAFMGVGMVFFGLELMKDACGTIKEMPEFEQWFQAANADSYLGVLGCVLIGCLLTFVVQSSSATLGITISLAFQGVISYPTAAALVMGENIGTTITAYLASLGTTTNARRAAYFHIIFNTIGVLWITLIFSWYVKFIPWLINVDVAAAVTENGKQVYPHTTAAIAAAHSLFNVTNTLLFLPFVPFFTRLLTKLVPSKSFKEKPHLTDLDIRMLDTPLLAIEQSRKELDKMSDGCAKMMEWFAVLLQQDERDGALSDRLKHRERVLDSVEDEMAAFITILLSGNVPHSVAEQARRQLRIADEYESVSDYIANLNRFDRKLRKDSFRFTTAQRDDILLLHGIVSDYLDSVNEGLRQQNTNIATKLESSGKNIRHMIRDLRVKHLDDLSDGNIPPQVSVAFMATLNAYSRIGDHSRDIAETISNER